MLSELEWVETAAEDYREGDLDRFSSYEKIVRALNYLKKLELKELLIIFWGCLDNLKMIYSLQSNLIS